MGPFQQSICWFPSEEKFSLYCQSVLFSFPLSTQHLQSKFLFIELLGSFGNGIKSVVCTCLSVLEFPELSHQLMGKTLEYVGSAKGPFVFNFQFCFRCCRGEDLMLFPSIIFLMYFFFLLWLCRVLVAVQALLWLWSVGFSLQWPLSWSMGSRLGGFSSCSS